MVVSFVIPARNTLKIPRWPPSRGDPYLTLNSHHSRGHTLKREGALVDIDV